MKIFVISGDGKITHRVNITGLSSHLSFKEMLYFRGEEK